MHFTRRPLRGVLREVQLGDSRDSRERGSLKNAKKSKSEKNAGKRVRVFRINSAKISKTIGAHKKVKLHRFWGGRSSGNDTSKITFRSRVALKKVGKVNIFDWFWVILQKILTTNFNPGPSIYAMRIIPLAGASTEGPWQSSVLFYWSKTKFEWTGP